MAGYTALSDGATGLVQRGKINTQFSELFGENGKAWISVADAAALAAIPAAYLTAGKFVYQVDTATLYQWNGAAFVVSSITVDALDASSATIGALTGILKGTAGAVGVATAKTDYAPATVGAAILKGSGDGGFANAIAKTDYAPATAGTAILKGDGVGGFSNATAKTDYAPATSGSAILKGDGVGGFSNATAKTDYAPATSGSAILKGDGLGGFASATANTDYAAASASARFTAEGGLIVKAVAGENLNKGEVVAVLQSPSGATGKVYKTPTTGNSNDMPLGVVYANALQDADVWIVVSGIAEILPQAADTAARGYVLTASTATAGRVAQAATAPAAATHFKEVGHWLDDGAGAGLITRAIIHFN